MLLLVCLVCIGGEQFQCTVDQSMQSQHTVRTQRPIDTFLRGFPVALRFSIFGATCLGNDDAAATTIAPRLYPQPSAFNQRLKIARQRRGVQPHRLRQVAWTDRFEQAHMPHERILCSLQSGFSDFRIIVLRYLAHELPDLVIGAALRLLGEVDLHTAIRLPFAAAIVVATSDSVKLVVVDARRGNSSFNSNNAGTSMETPTSSAHPLDAAIALSPSGSDGYTGHTSPAYANMVGPFGGVIASTLLNAVMSHPALLGDPVSLTVHYTAPIADGDFSVTTRTMRTNRSTQHWLVELTQEGQVAAYATAVTALRRETWGTTDASFPAVPQAAAVEPMPPLPHAAWTSCYEMRIIDGGPGVPAREDTPSQTRLWLRDQPPRPLDFLSLAAISDAFFPRIFVRRPQQLVPIGTVVLTTFFHADAEQLRALGSEHVLGVARGLHFGKGFFDQSAEVWSAAGDMLASSHQVVYFKE